MQAKSGIVYTSAIFFVVLEIVFDLKLIKPYNANGSVIYAKSEPHYRRCFLTVCQRWTYDILHRFCMDAFQKFGFTEKEAHII